MKKVPANIEVTPFELAVLEALWARGAATIREITGDVYSDSTTATYATVQKLLERLEKKGCVKRDRGNFAHEFSAVIERKDLIGQGLENLANQLCEGSHTPLLIHLVGSGRLNEKERDALRKLIDES